MSLPEDIFTPWRDPPHGLEERHVGRTAELGALVSALNTFANGKRPLPLYVHGPRGFGKSHLLALARHRVQSACDAQGVQVITVSEDIPTLTTAAALVSRIQAQDTPAWMASTIAAPPTPGRRVVFVEGLDKHLLKMKAPQRRGLREWLVEHPDVLIVATGVGLPKAMGREGAFYGFFDPYPVHPLDVEEATELLERLVPAELQASPHWPARLAALVALAGGSPRTLSALGQACAAHPQALASDHLLAVVRSFTAHYQMRFADLSPQEQSIDAQLAIAPRELSPTELGRGLDRGTSHASQLARRLENSGVVAARPEGRATWYSLTEPLFRHWYEYRPAPWEQARASMVGRLLEAVLSPKELIDAWWENPDLRVREAANEVIGRDQGKLRQAWNRIVKALHPDARLPDSAAEADRTRALILRANTLAPDEFSVGQFIVWVAWFHPQLMEEARPVLERAELPATLAAWSFCVDVAGAVAPRQAVRRLIPRLVSALPGKRIDWHSALQSFQTSHINTQPRGRSWRLTELERAQLATVPMFRAHFLLRGKRPDHPPLLDPADLLGAGLSRPLMDGPQLLTAAFRRHDPTLFEFTAQVILQDGIEFYALPFAPDPGVRCPPAPDTLTPGHPRQVTVTTTSRTRRNI